MARVESSSARWQVTEHLYVGYSSEGTLELHDGGEVEVGEWLIVGNNLGVTGRVIVEGAGAELRSSVLSLGQSGNGTLTLANGGTVTVDGGDGTVDLGEQTGSHGTLNFGAYDLAAPTTAGVLGADRLHIGPVSFGSTGTINFNQTDTLALAADIQEGWGAASVNQRGTGTTILTGTNSYSGDTTISDGTLLVNGSIQYSSVNVNGGTLGGSGLLTGATTVNTGGALAPGNSIGILSTGDVTANTGSTLQFEVDSTGASDTLAVTGGVTLNDGGYRRHRPGCARQPGNP